MNLPKNIIDTLKNIIEFESKDENEKDINNEIEKFIKNYIGIEKYSYHQLNIFLKLFISIYSKCESKLLLADGKIDLAEAYLNEFSESTKYITNGIFAKSLVVKNDARGKKDYI